MAERWERGGGLEDVTWDVGPHWGSEGNAGAFVCAYARRDIASGGCVAGTERCCCAVSVGESEVLHRAARHRRDAASRRGADYGVVSVRDCLWSLDEEEIGGEDVKVLMLTLVKPALSAEEVTWKRGLRQDNRSATRRDGAGALDQRRGYRFFADDEDEFGLEAVLQALCFHYAGAAFVPPQPWQHGVEAHWARTETALPPPARALLGKLRQQAPRAA